MHTQIFRSTLIILIFLLALSACASEPADSAADAPIAQAEAPSVEDSPEPTAEEAVAPAVLYNACDMLTQDEIEAAALGDFPAGSGQPGTDSPVFLGEAVSCAWEVGNPEAQFHKRLHLYIITLDGQDPSAAFDAQVGRLVRAEERSGIGDRAAYAPNSGFLAVLDGDFLFLIRANFNTSDDTEAKLGELALLVISRK